MTEFILPYTVSEGSPTGLLILSIVKEARIRGYELTRLGVMKHGGHLSNMAISYIVHKPGDLQAEVMRQDLTSAERATVNSDSYKLLTGLLDRLRQV